jgi:ATP-binding cassette, subfamily C, bacterial
MSSQASMLRLLSRAPMADTAMLFGVMLLARLTEGIGLFLLIPLLETVSDAGTQSAITQQLSSILARFGIDTGLGPLLIIFVALVALRGMLLLAQQSQSARYQYRTVDTYRQQLFERILRAEWRWLSDQRASDLANLLTTGAGRIGVGLSQLIALIAGSVTLLAYSAAALILSWQVTLVTIAIGAIAYFLFSGHRHRAAALGHAVTAANRALQGRIQEGLAAVRLTKLSGAEDRHIGDFAETIRQLRAQQIAFTTGTARGDMALQLGGAATLALLLYGGIDWLALPVSVMLTMVLIFARLMPVFAGTQQSYHHWLHARAGLEEFEAKLTEASQVAEPEAVKTIARLPLQQAIHFDGVSFGYADAAKPVLRDISIGIAANTTVKISGESGSGKSTFADLLTGLLQSGEGRILIDGNVLDASNRQAWRRSIAYVQQDSFLFHDTILANLQWANPDASMAEIKQALQQAAADFVFSLPDGLNSIVGDAGQKLSGGERQRIALARALLAKPSLLVLDEATSALDRENEALVHKALANLRGSMTIIIIGHRQSHHEMADQWLHFEDGLVTSRLPEKVTL